MKKWSIDFEDINEIRINPEQRWILDRKITSSLIVDGRPGTGKTLLAILKTVSMHRNGQNCLYIPRTSLYLKYANHAFRSLGLYDQVCLSYYEYEQRSTSYDVVIVDDSHLYSLEQIQRIASSAKSLLLFGDYSSTSMYEKDKARIEDLAKVIRCEVFKLCKYSVVPSSFMKLISKGATSQVNLSSQQTKLPFITKIATIEDQCKSVREIVEKCAMKDVGILCYTRKLVETVYAVLNTKDFPVEVYLPGMKEGTDTFNLDSGNPKILTISSSIGVHFRTVFVLGFDRKIVWNNQDEATRVAVTRPTENLYIFYENQLPEPLASISKDFYLTKITGLNESSEL